MTKLLALCTFDPKNDHLDVLGGQLISINGDPVWSESCISRIATFFEANIPVFKECMALLCKDQLECLVGKIRLHHPRSQKLEQLAKVQLGETDNEHEIEPVDCTEILAKIPKKDQEGILPDLVNLTEGVYRYADRIPKAIESIREEDRAPIIRLVAPWCTCLPCGRSRAFVLQVMRHVPTSDRKEIISEILSVFHEAEFDCDSTTPEEFAEIIGPAGKLMEAFENAHERKMILDAIIKLERKERLPVLNRITYIVQLHELVAGYQIAALIKAVGAMPDRFRVHAIFILHILKNTDVYFIDVVGALIAKLEQDDLYPLRLQILTAEWLLIIDGGSSIREMLVEEFIKNYEQFLPLLLKTCALLRYLTMHRTQFIRETILPDLIRSA